MGVNEHIRILELAEARRLPQTVDSSAEVDLEAFEELYDAGYIKAVDASSMDGPAWLEPRITVGGRGYLRELKGAKAAGEKGDTAERLLARSTSSLSIFISHSSRDHSITLPLVELLQAGLSIPAASIRCTSLDGYRLPSGVDTDAALRSEVYRARAFIGLISPQSLKSSYVVFELGARWGAERPLIPLLAPGLSIVEVPPPLNRLNAVSCDREEQLYQMVEDLSEVLGIEPQSPSVYRRYISQIQAARARDDLGSASEAAPATKPADLPDEQLRIMKVLAGSDDRLLDVAQITSAVEQSRVRTQHHLDQLMAAGLVEGFQGPMEPTAYGLSRQGRAFLVENRLI